MAKSRFLFPIQEFEDDTWMKFIMKCICIQEVSIYLSGDFGMLESELCPVRCTISPLHDLEK